jgi:hypothetical protein
MHSRLFPDDQELTFSIEYAIAHSRIIALWGAHPSGTEGHGRGEGDGNAAHHSVLWVVDHQHKRAASSLIKP